MNKTHIVQSIKEMLDNAEASIKSARHMLVDLDSSTESNYEPMPSHNNASHDAVLSHEENKNFKASETMDGQNRIVEGRFDGQNMIGPDKKSYPVPANYASKSKLVPGDILKLTVMPNGSFVYKQIGPVPRKRIIGTLCYEDGAYKVVAEGKSYSVLLASVTYFKAEIGDKAALIVPELEDVDWGAIENIIDGREAENATFGNEGNINLQVENF
jgi:hypothetical protein